MNTRTIIYVVIIVVALLVVMFLLTSFAGGKKMCKMKEYSYSSGGDMRGSHYSEIVKRLDDNHALISFSRANWYADDPKVSEYIADAKILIDLGEIFSEYNMQRWHNKKFTNEFVCDGASASYRFRFEDEDDVYFSSQIYPSSYREKLAEFDKVIKKYVEQSEKLPCLKRPVLSDEEKHKLIYPKDSLVRLEVYKYGNMELNYRVCNGTSEDVGFEEKIKLFDVANGKIIKEHLPAYAFKNTVSPNRREEQVLYLDSLLDVGIYRLEVDKYSCEFEIVKAENEAAE